MTIGTNAASDFFGSQTELTVASPGAVTTKVLSVAADINTFTNADDAREAAVTVVASFTVAPVAGDSIDLYARKMNVANTTDDDIEPATTFLHEYVGRFPLKAQAGEQVITRDIALPNYKTSSEYDFYIYNNTLQTITASTWELHITPKTVGPHG